MFKTQSALLATTAIALIISGHLWLELRAERKLSRSNPGVQTPHLPEAVPQSGSKLATPGAQDSPPTVLPPEPTGTAKVVPSITTPPRDSEHARLIALEYARPRYSLEASRQQLARLYPELRTGAGLSDGEIETVAGLMSRGAYPAEFERALGASTYQRLMDYRRPIDTRREVEYWQKRLPNPPLDENQVQVLAAILLDEQRWHDEQSPREPPATSDPRSRMENELRAARLELMRRENIIERARVFLSEEQIAALQNDGYAVERRAQVAALEAELGGGG